MTKTIGYTGELTATECWCGIHFAAPASLVRIHDEDGGTLYCPLGHASVRRKTDAQILRDQLAHAERQAATRLAALDQEKASHAATKGQLTKAKKRVVNGVCPCCNRSFQNVARHMKTRHPEQVQETHT